MTSTLKTIGLIALGGALAAGCGQRGALERPDPIFGAPASETAPAELPDREEADTVILTPPRETNELGGEIPEASPVEPVEESPIAEPKDDDEA